MRNQTEHQKLVAKCLSKFLVSPFGDGRSFECHQVGGLKLYCRGWGNATGHDITIDPERLYEFERKGWTWQDTRPELTFPDHT